MRKLLSMLLVLLLMMSCTSAMAELRVPRTMEEIPNLQEPVKIPEYEMVIEDGYVVLVTDWFDDAEDLTDAFYNTVSYHTNLEDPYYHTTYMVYDAERGAFVTKEPAEYTTVDWIFFTKHDKDGSYYSVNAVQPENGEDFPNEFLRGDGWSMSSWSGYPQLLRQTRNYTYYWYWNEKVWYWEDRQNKLAVVFDESGNAMSYKYHVPGPDLREGYGGKLVRDDVTIVYDMNGKLINARLFVGGAWLEYEYDDYWGDEWSYNYKDTMLPGYTVESLMATYPPLVGGKPVRPASGDINGSGKVDITDVLGVSKYLAGEGKTIDLNAANVNGDAHVDTKDVLHLMQYFSGWDVELK